MFARPSKVYLPVSTTWPKLVLIAADAHPPDAQPPRPGGWTSLTVFARRAQQAPLEQETSVAVRRGRLPRPLSPGADPPLVDRDRAVRLARALAAHWTHDTAGVPGFASTGLLDADLAADRARRRRFSKAAWTAHLLGGRAGVRAVPVQDGTLVVADFRIRKRVRAVGPDSTVSWTGDYAEVLGGRKRSTLVATTYLGAVWFQPAGGGDAVPLGATRAPALF